MNVVFYIAAVVAVLSTGMVITRLNAVHSLLYLIVSLMSISISFYVLGAPFIAALEVIIYAGAIMVLFVFVIMMLPLGPETVKQEREWLRELTYLSRHETQPAFSPEDMAAKPPKTLRGVDPNLQNTRQSHKAAEEARAVYDKTVAKLRELYPKHSRKLDATSGKNTLQPNDNLDDLPIFAAPTQDASAELPADIDEVADEAPIRALKAEPLGIGQAEPAMPAAAPPGG